MQAKNILLVAVAALGACAGPRPNYDPRVMLIGSTQSFLEVDGAKLIRDGGTPLFVAEVTNVSVLGASDFQWCVEFLGDAGQQVAASDTRWVTMRLERGETKRVQLACGATNATNFVFKLK